MKPRCTAQGQEHNHWTMENVDPIFQYYLSMKTNIPNVTYITMFEFLLQEIELKMEINHLMSIMEFVSDYNAKSNVGIRSTHAIFYDYEKAATMDDEGES
jgi:hypothetical protein